MIFLDNLVPGHQIYHPGFLWDIRKHMSPFVKWTAAAGIKEISVQGNRRIEEGVKKVRVRFLRPPGSDSVGVRRAINGTWVFGKEPPTVPCVKMSRRVKMSFVISLCPSGSL